MPNDKPQQIRINQTEAEKRLKEEGMNTSNMVCKGAYDNGCFYIDGLKTYDGAEIRMNHVVGRSGMSDYDQLGGLKGKIPGVKCPDCGAQGFRTDHPQIASCGAYPGWFFYYLEEKELDDTDSEYTIKIINGEPQLVAVTDKETKEEL